MKKKIYIVTLLSLFAFTNNAYAVIDIPAILQSALKLKSDIENKLVEIQKLKQDAQKTVRQGFEIGKNCFSDPKSCYKDAKSLKHDAESTIQGIRSVGSELKSSDLMIKNPKDLADSIINDGTYKKGQGQDIIRKATNEAVNNAIVTDLLAILFAKGVVTRQSILQENPELYNRSFKDESNIEEILYAQNTLMLNSDRRIARILELRTFMFNAQAIKELTQYNREAKEDE